MSEPRALSTDLEAIKGIAKSIAEELRAHPDHWMKGALVRFKDGVESSSGIALNSDNAICWCLEGHICRRVSREVHSQALMTFREAVNIETLFRWNDEPARTVEDVIALCEKVAMS